MADPTAPLSNIADAVDAFQQAGSPKDLLPQVQSFVGRQYAALDQQGYFATPDGQQVGHALRAQGFVSDPTQGGAVKAAPLPSYRSHDDAPPAPLTIAERPVGPVRSFLNGAGAVLAPLVSDAKAVGAGAVRTATDVSQAMQPAPGGGFFSVNVPAIRRAANDLNPFPAVAGPGTMLSHGAQALGAQAGGQQGAFGQFLRGVPAGVIRETQQHPVQQVMNVAGLLAPAFHAALPNGLRPRGVPLAAEDAAAGPIRPAPVRAAPAAAKVPAPQGPSAPVLSILPEAAPDVAAPKPVEAMAPAALPRPSPRQMPPMALPSEGVPVKTIAKAPPEPIPPPAVKNLSPDLPAPGIQAHPTIPAPGVKTLPLEKVPAPAPFTPPLPKAAPGTPPPMVSPVDPRLVSDFPVSQLHTDPARFQYKMNSGTGGQTGSLTGAPAWNPDFAGVVHAWRDPADGRAYVVNGHNRVALAGRVGQKTMDVRFLDAKTADDARTKGAMINIAEGQGTALDAAKMFRDKGVTPEALRAQGVNLTGQKAAQGLSLSRLSPPLFGMAVRGELPLERAAIIGDKLPKAEDQSALVGLLNRQKGTVTNDVISELADQVNAAPRHTSTAASLFGDEDTTQNLAVHRADVAAYVKSQLRGEGAVMNTAARNAGRLSKANNVIDAEASAKMADLNRQGAEVFDRVKNSSGPVSDILNAAAQRIARGEKPNAVKSDALSQFQSALPDLVRPTSAAPAGPGLFGDDAPAPARPAAGQSVGTSDGNTGGRPQEVVLPQGLTLGGVTLPHLDSSAGAFGGKAVSDLLEHATDLVGAQIGEHAAAARDLAQDTAHKAQGGRYRDSYRISKAAGDALNAHVAAPEAGKTIGFLTGKYVTQGLDAGQRALFMRHLQDQRAQGIEAAGGAPNRQAIPKLSAADQSRVAADPLIQRALSRHAQGPQQALLALRQFVSPRMKTAGTPSGHFLSLVPEEKMAPGGRGPSARSGPASLQRVKGTTFAKQATGTADAYAQDYPAVLRHLYSEVAPKATLRQFYKTVLAERDAQGNRLAYSDVGGKKLPDTIHFNGVDHPAATREYNLGPGVDGAPKVLRVAMPADIARNFDDATLAKSDPQGMESVAHKAQGLVTGLTLSNPASVLSHANRLLNVAKAVPDVGGPLARRMASLMPGLSYPAAAKRLMDFDPMEPEDAAALRRVVEANGGVARPFDETIGHGLLGKTSGLAHSLLFGLPEKRGSLVGMDLRMRATAEKVRARLEGNTDPQRVREFANQFGQYVRKPDPLIEAAKKIHPFAATSLPLRMTELRQLVGDTGLRGLTPGQHALIRTQSLLGGAAGTALAATFLNHALSGHYPWQNAPGHEFDIQAGHDRDGKPVYFAGNVAGPTLTRPLKALGLTDVERDARAHAKPSQYVGDVLRGGYNAVGEELSSPMANALTTGVAGKDPFYLTRKGEYLSTAARAKSGQDQHALNAVTGIGQMNPLLALLAQRYTGQPVGVPNGPFVSPALRAADVAGRLTQPFLKKDAPVRSGGRSSGGMRGGPGSPR